MRSSTEEEAALATDDHPEQASTGLSSTPVTALLKAWNDGEAGALEALTPLVYDELKKLARAAFRAERPGHTLQPTAVVHEAFVNLIHAEVDWQSRAHFYALSARMMRRILVDHARARDSDKRGGQFVQTSLTGDIADNPADTDMLDLDDALSELAALDQRKSELMELKLFAGLSFREMSEVTGLSSSTLDRELRMARAWLQDRLAD